MYYLATLNYELNNINSYYKDIHVKLFETGLPSVQILLSYTI